MVKKLLCTLPNASSNINGIEFESYKLGGMVSVDPVDKLDQTVVHRFLKVGGYKLIDVDKEPSNGKQEGEMTSDESAVHSPESQSVLVNKPHKKTGRSKDKEITNE
ncbi:hypothetical protein [Nitrosomonas sp. Nm132]|jgi:hypothetical protein|uniref:hypothetical protein n=1 Tax=Nitrosomonas sp. Nm132 TaxID=1881053 RepID=UPI00087EC0D1|nr:hypothetical protein [Nitrosomonas sp. Nm132]SDH27089.1 hypothetical protein SAMN05428952_100969 [Nitrosomonas sp. Nm132]